MLNERYMHTLSLCLLTGHLDSRTSIQRVLLVTFSVALVFSLSQVNLLKQIFNILFLPMYSFALNF